MRERHTRSMRGCAHRARVAALLGVASLLAGCGSGAVAAPVKPKAPSSSVPASTSSTPATSSTDSRSTTDSSSAATPQPSPRPAAYRVVGLGDSVPSGYHCNCTNFVDLYASDIQHDTGVRTTASDDALAGAVSSDVVSELRSGTDIARSVERADFVVVNVGANDFAVDREAYDNGHCGGEDHLDCFLPQIAPMQRNLTTIVRRINALTKGPVAIRVLDYWNVFEDGDVGRQEGAAFVHDSDQLTRLADRSICAAASAGGAVCVRTYAAFKGAGDKDATPLLATDGDHPNAKGHRVLAGLLQQAGYAPVT